MWSYTKRSSFILLEVFIALSLLCIALHLLISTPSLCFHRELRMLKQVEIARLEDLAYIELLEKLPEILPHVILKRDKKEEKPRHRIDLSQQVIYIKNRVSSTYCPYAIVWLQKESKGRKLLRCNIVFDPTLKKPKSNNKFMYKIMVHEEEKKIHNLN